VESPVDAARVFRWVRDALSSFVDTGARDHYSVGQHMPFSFFPESEGDAVRLEDFFRRVVAEVSPPLIRHFGRRNNLPFLTLPTKGTGSRRCR
jgi:hypothetical protein